MRIDRPPWISWAKGPLVRRALILLSVSFLSVLLTCSSFSKNPSWSKEKLDAAAAYAEQIGSAAVLVLHDSQVVFSYGNITRKYVCHSIRKPFLGALYGIQVERGVIALDTTLEELKIDDIPPSLTPAEKQAAICFCRDQASITKLPAKFSP